MRHRTAIGATVRPRPGAGRHLLARLWVPVLIGTLRPSPNVSN
jgi:hypothetical protein